MYFSIFRENIVHALKANLAPGLVLQVLAISIAVCYFFWPDSHIVFNLISELKATYQWKYAFVSTALFGGIIPCLYLYLSGQFDTFRTSYIVLLFLFYSLFWAYKGVEVDFFYIQQARWFGDALDVSTIIKKTAVDQFLYSALWAAPTITIAYLWKDSNFNFRETKSKINKELFLLKIPTVVISNWLIWIPAVSIIYTMPTPLQIPLFNLVLCFFVLILASLNRKG